MEVAQFENIKYITKYPQGYKSGERYPVIIFLHGAGGRGTDINVIMNNPYFRLSDKHPDFPFITIAPQCSAETWFDLFETLKRLVYKITEATFTDKDRIYVMGASMGGYAAWQLAISMPEFFAGIVPICGGGMYWDAARLVNVPVWAFHGEKDDVVLVEESKKMVDAVKRSGGDARLTIYPDCTHDAWSNTYNNPEVFKWLLGNTNKNPERLNNIFKDSNIYG